MSGVSQSFKAFCGTGLVTVTMFSEFYTTGSSCYGGSDVAASGYYGDGIFTYD